MKLKSLLSSLEQEGIPEESGRGHDKYIEKVGTQWCIRSNGVDQNFGCWPSKEKAEAVMRGESFITPDVPKNLLASKDKCPKCGSKKFGLMPADFETAKCSKCGKTWNYGIKAGGPGSGRKKQAMKEYQRIYQLAKQAGHNDDKAKQIAKEAYIEKFQRMYAGGPGSGRKSSTAKGLNQWKTVEQERRAAAKDPKQQKLPLKAFGPAFPVHVKSPYKSASGHGAPTLGLAKLQKPSAGHTMSNPGVNHKMPNMPMKNGKGSGHRFSNPQFMEAGGPGSGPHQHQSPTEELVRLLRPHKDAFIDERIHDPSNHKTLSLKEALERAEWMRNLAEMGVDHRVLEASKKKKKLIEAVDWGEPNAGAYQHGHMDTNLWFTPPSLKKRGKGTYVPTDDPQEKDDKYLDVTKRKEAHKQRMGLLKRSAPGGLAPNIPVRTTLISPTLNSYLPMYSSAIKASKARQRRSHGGGNFRAYGAAKI